MIQAEQEVILKVPSGRQARGDVFLYHGLTGVPFELQTLSSSLNDNDFNVIVPFLSGHESLDSLRRTHLSTWLDQATSVVDNKSAPAHPLVLVGLSFGSLLAAYVASKLSNRVSALILLSPPVQLKNFKDELLLSALSYLPDFLLDLLGIVPKQERERNSFAFERQGLRSHSIAASARVMQLRRLVLNNLHKLTAPTLILYDPQDHLLSDKGIESLRPKLSNVNLTIEIIPGGQHELTLGHSYSLVNRFVNEWLNGILPARI